MEKVFNIFNMGKAVLQDNEISYLESRLWQSPNSERNYSNLYVNQLEQNIMDLRNDISSLHNQVQTLTRALLRAHGKENV